MMCFWFAGGSTGCFSWSLLGVWDELRVGYILVIYWLYTGYILVIYYLSGNFGGLKEEVLVGLGFRFLCTFGV